MEVSWSATKERNWAVREDDQGELIFSSFLGSMRELTLHACFGWMDEIVVLLYITGSMLTSVTDSSRSLLLLNWCFMFRFYHSVIWFSLI